MGYMAVFIGCCFCFFGKHALTVHMSHIDGAYVTCLEIVGGLNFLYKEGTLFPPPTLNKFIKLSCSCSENSCLSSSANSPLSFHLSFLQILFVSWSEVIGFLFSELGKHFFLSLFYWNIAFTTSSSSMIGGSKGKVAVGKKMGWGKKEIDRCIYVHQQRVLRMYNNGGGSVTSFY